MKRLLSPAFAMFAIYVSFTLGSSVGCNAQPGPVIQGKASTADFGSKGHVEKGPDGEDLPRGVFRQN